jgi:acyl phosphate:glycerol-3-phosphate acyltransferase
MPHTAVLPLLILVSYLFGAIPFGYLVARWRGVDIRRAGSGNIGATNVWRVLGTRYGLLVFALDFAKGAIPVLAAYGIAGNDGSENLGWSRESLGVAAGLAAFLGHLFPVYLRLRGGKGVATGAGVVAVLLPIPTLAALFAWIAVVSATGYVSLSSLTAAVVLCAARFGLTDRPLAPANRLLTVFCLVAGLLVFLRHRSNVARLIRRDENRMGESPTMLLFSKVVHVYALGLWFGSMVFFILATLSLFDTFQKLATSETGRPTWLRAVDDFDAAKATQLAGIAVSPLFTWYFPLQTVCGILAAATALGWCRRQAARLVDRVRARVLWLATCAVLIGWPLAHYVNQLRLQRYSDEPGVAALAKQAFGTWHTYSLLLNFAVLTLVSVGMGLAAVLPEAPPPPPRSKADDSPI